MFWNTSPISPSQHRAVKSGPLCLLHHRQVAASLDMNAQQLDRLREEQGLLSPNGDLRELFQICSLPAREAKYGSWEHLSVRAAVIP